MSVAWTSGEVPRRYLIHWSREGNKSVPCVTEDTSVKPCDSIFEMFLRMPYSLIALRSNGVVFPTQLQACVWPSLVKDLDTLIVGPAGSGKLMCLLPFVAYYARKCTVLIVSPTHQRSKYVIDLLGRVPGLRRSNCLFPPPAETQCHVVGCTPTSCKVKGMLQGADIVILDQVHIIVTLGITVLSNLHDRLEEVQPRPNIIATSEYLSDSVIEVTKKLGISAIIGSSSSKKNNVSRSRNEIKCTIEYDVRLCEKRKPYNLLKDILRDVDAFQSTVIVFEKTPEDASNLAEMLERDESLKVVGFHGTQDAELARNDLVNLERGIFVVAATDQSWMHNVKNIDLIINVESVTSPSCFQIRRRMLHDGGRFVLLLSAINLILIESWLLDLLPTSADPSIRKVIDAYRTLKRSLQFD